MPPAPSNTASPPTSPYDQPRLYGAVMTMNRQNGKVLNKVFFQYNPDELTRTLTPRVIKEGSDGFSYRLSGEPKQKISCTVLVEATTAMDQGKGVNGVYPPLAAMETLLYPSSDELKKYEQSVQQGKLWVVPPEQPSTIFYWGPGRFLPVVIENMTVTETFFNGDLKPIEAKIKLDMTVLSLQDADQNDHSLLMTALSRLEKMAENMPQKHTDLF